MRAGEAEYNELISLISGVGVAASLYGVFLYSSLAFLPEAASSQMRLTTPTCLIPGIVGLGPYTWRHLLTQAYACAYAVAASTATLRSGRLKLKVPPPPAVRVVTAVVTTSVPISLWL